MTETLLLWNAGFLAGTRPEPADIRP